MNPEQTPAGRRAPDLGFLEAAAISREEGDRRRKRIALGFPVIVTVVWFVAVLLTGNFGRIWDNIVAAPTMLFGSFIAGATPQGGGAVAFPVFTKALGVPPEVARTFSLAIQSIGMTAASIAILVRRRAISIPAVLWSLPAALLGLFIGLFFFSNRNTPFYTSVLPGPYVKVMFTLLVVGIASVVYLGSRVQVREVRTSIDPLGGRQIGFLLVGALLGGLVASQVGSGADVMFYLVVVVMMGLEPRIAVPSSVLVMTVVSLAGFVYLGLIRGQLDVTVVGDYVTQVGQTVLADPTQYPAARFDLLGLWLAAVPVVCWGAPLGSAFAARITTRQLALFEALLASIELITTLILVKQLRTDMGLLAFAVIGGALLVGTLILCVRFRHRIAQVRVDPSKSITREGVDVASDYLEHPPEKDGQT